MRISLGENYYMLSAKNPVYSNSVADQGSGAFLIPGSGSGIPYVFLDLGSRI